MRVVYRIKQLILMGGDFLSFCLAFYLSLGLRNLSLPSWEQILNHSTVFLIVFFLWLVINYINGLYDLERQSNLTKFYRRLIEAAVISLLISVIFFYLIPNDRITPKTILILNVLFGYSLSAIWRLIYNKLVGAKKLQTNIILVGYTDETEELIDILQKNPERGYKITALIDPDHSVKNHEHASFEVYHGLHTIRPAITNTKAHLVVIAPHLQRNDEALRELYELLFWNVQITNFPSFYEVVTGRITPSVFSEGWFLEHLKNKEQPIYDNFRALVDYLAGVSVGLIFLVLLPFIAVAIKLNSKGPIFFRQKRVGKNGKIFTIYKFRSMFALSADGSAEIDGFQFAEKKDKRVTFVGIFLRKTRLDELPQFINLLKRDITLIGPRPERPEIVKKIEEKMPFFSLRHVVRPGLTGWAVIHQNYTNTEKEYMKKLQYDLYYIKNKSLLLDLSVFLRTINVVLRMMGQ